ncbi:MAG: tetratricopeptide repeat protein [Verrucomicrobiales bacterium]|nr:tetratricopeptide repeat protein [Verrucomicrobiales bacterium]
MEDAGSLFAYRRGWSAINTLLDKGGSLSGRERHCAYLNVGEHDGEVRFADVSASAGLDFKDDGRLDFFVSNRTAPRVRFLHNRSVTENGFVALRLEGVNCNRDAIGARVELTGELKGERKRWVKTLRAGEGFLAQSSKWVHFGVPSGAVLGRVEVWWPGGEREGFDGIEEGNFMKLVEGSGRAAEWERPGAVEIGEREFEALPETGLARVYLPARVPMPEFEWEGFDGVRRGVAGSGKPRLLNLWATWCVPCLAEMKAWAGAKAELDAVGLEILALSVDGLDEATGTSAADAGAYVEKTGFPFLAGKADAALVQTLELVADAMIDKHNRLPVPSSVLLDRDGEVAAIYKGGVDVEQLVKDVGRLRGTAEQLRDNAAQFPGRWIEPPPRANPSRLVENFVLAGEVAGARDYLDTWVRVRKRERGKSPDIAESYYFIANTLRAKGEMAEAVVAYERALEFQPGQPRVHLDLGTVLAGMRRHGEAVGHLEVAVTTNPNDVDTRRRLVLAMVNARRAKEALPHLELLVEVEPNDPTAQLLLAKSLKSNGRPAEAKAAYGQALELRPGWALAANELGWMLATHPDASVRDGAEAVRLATVANEATRGQEPAVLDTVAAAYAEVGRFDEAVAVVEDGLETARGRGSAALVAMLENRLKFYRSGRPFRDGDE